MYIHIFIFFIFSWVFMRAPSSTFTQSCFISMCVFNRCKVRRVFANFQKWLFRIRFYLILSRKEFRKKTSKNGSKRTPWRTIMDFYRRKPSKSKIFDLKIIYRKLEALLMLCTFHSDQPNHPIILKKKGRVDIRESKMAVTQRFLSIRISCRASSDYSAKRKITATGILFRLDEEDKEANRR